MSTTETPPQPCPTCAAPLADDQRYCLSCGEVRPGARRPLPAALRRPAGAPSPQPAAPAAGQLPSLAAALAGLACLLLAMGVGVLIGRGGEQAAPAPITIAGAAASAPAPGATTAAPASFQSDWPDGREGWTIALQSLPRAGSDAAAVAAAKTAASSKGAPAVGALDSDSYPSLASGSYVVFSGIYRSRDVAGGALKPLKATFADARVVEVAKTASAASATTTTPSSSKATPTTPKPAARTGNAFEDSKKQPKTTGTGGRPPPKDKQPAAGGGGFESIG